MQQILHGIEHLREALRDSRKALLVCGRSFASLSIRQEIEAGAPCPLVRFDDFRPNPLYEDVCRGVELFRSEGCDAILAVGGGSALDVAKSIKLYCQMPKDRLYLEQEYKDTGVRLVAVPTTAGRGSESTRFAVIYYDGKKQSVTHESIIPDVAILEPKVLKTLPIYQKKCTLLDALCQGIESWLSVNSTDESRALSRFAVEAIMRWWREYLFDNTDEASARIMAAANRAGQAICITQTTAPHAFSYQLTSLYGLPHGHAVAICLPEIWQYMLDHPEKCIDARGWDYVDAVFAEIAASMSCVSATDAIKEFRAMLMRMEMVTHPATSNWEEDLSLLSSSVNPIRLKNNPIELDALSIVGLYLRILKRQ